MRTGEISLLLLPPLLTRPPQVSRPMDVMGERTALEGKDSPPRAPPEIGVAQVRSRTIHRRIPSWKTEVRQECSQSIGTEGGDARGSDAGSPRRLARCSIRSVDG